MIVFLLSGLWHGANWTFILWGVCHGIFSVINRHYKKQFERMHPALSWLITFIFVNVTWVLFRANSIRDAARLLYRIILFDFGEIASDIVTVFNLPEVLFLNRFVHIFERYPRLSLIIFFTLAFVLLLGPRNASEKASKFIPTISKAVFTAFLLVWCIFSFSGVSTFLYFNF